MEYSGETTLISWVDHITRFRLPIIRQVQETLDLAGVGIELGAGTSWLSSVLSQSPHIGQLTAVDHDPYRFALAQAFFLPAFNGNAAKIKFFVGDYHNLPFRDFSFDFAVADASLHHAADLAGLLTEIRRILKPKGIFV